MQYHPGGELKLHGPGWIGHDALVAWRSERSRTQLAHLTGSGIDARAIETQPPVKGLVASVKADVTSDGAEAFARERATLAMEKAKSDAESKALLETQSAALQAATAQRKKNNEAQLELMRADLDRLRASSVTPVVRADPTSWYCVFNGSHEV